MKSIIKLFNRGLLIAIASGGVWLGFEVGLHADSGDLDANSAACNDDRYSRQGLVTDCVSLNKIAFNSVTAKVGWELNTEKMLPNAHDVGVSDSVISPEISAVNGSSAILATQSDRHDQVLSETASEASAPLSLDSGMHDERADNSSDSAISEPLLTSILALIAIVAVARRNVSGG